MKTEVTVEEIVEALEDLIVKEQLYHSVAGTAYDFHGKSKYDDLLLRLKGRTMPHLAKITLIDCQRKEIADLKAITTWQPMYTAPYEIDMIVWNAQDDVMELARLNKEYDTWESYDAIYDLGDEPYTCWMPLPQPPPPEIEEA